MKKFTYNDQVNFIKKDEDGKILSKTYAVVVSITPVETEEQSKHFNAPIGTTFYTVEFGDGSDNFVSEDMLEPFSEKEIGTSPDGKWVEVKDIKGNPTGIRIDNGHPNHSDPRGQQPHAHRPGVTNPDGTPWLPIK